MFSRISNFIASITFKQRIIILYSLLISYLFISTAILIDRSQVFPKLLSLGALAFFFGIKHALDADHIAVIDNTTRKLMNDGKKPAGVGFFFSVGHSLSVFFLTFMTVSIGAFVVKSYPAFSKISNVIGTGVSALFLYLIAIMNIAILLSIIRIAKNFKKYKDKSLEEELLKRGFMYRYFHRIMKLITCSWRMLYVGILFGLGCHTGPDVAILSMSAMFALSGHPLIDVFILPLIFSAGMIFLDSTDGVIMQFAYSWAFVNPVRKIFYNISITSISVFLALCIGTLEWLQVVAMELDLHSPVWNFIQNVSFSMLGGIIAATLIIAWFGSIAVYKFAKIEENFR